MEDGKGLWEPETKGANVAKRGKLNVVTNAGKLHFVWNSGKLQLALNNRQFSSCPKLLFSSEAKFKPIELKWAHANKTHFHQKDFALSFVMKVRVFATWRRRQGLEKEWLLLCSDSLKMRYIFLEEMCEFLKLPYVKFSDRVFTKKLFNSILLKSNDRSQILLTANQNRQN